MLHTREEYGERQHPMSPVAVKHLKANLSPLKLSLVINTKISVAHFLAMHRILLDVTGYCADINKVP